MQRIGVAFNHRLPEPARTTTRLLALDAEYFGRTRWTDVYYNAPHRDFTAADVISEWLRLRTETGPDDQRHTSINFTSWLPLGEPHPTHRLGYESAITDPDAVHKLLLALGFTEILTVGQTRERYRLNETRITIDTVNDLGAFIDLDYDGDAATVDDATEALHHTLAILNIPVADRDRRDYPYQLLRPHR